MVRPAYREDEKTARQKLVDAFWGSLEDGTFAKLTVSGICAGTGLNRNSFYYHFEDMNDLAKTVVSDTLAKDLPALMIAQSGKGAVGLAQAVDEGAYAAKFKRVCLLAGKNSTPMLQSMLKSAIAEIWCGALGVKLEALDRKERVTFEFCLGGVLSLLAFRNDTGLDITMGEMLEMDLAKDMLETMAKIGKSHRKSRNPLL